MMDKMSEMAVLAMAAIFFAAPVGADTRCDVRLRGIEGARMDECIEKNVARTDPLYLAECFTRRNETCRWQSEFWGKYMHSAVPFWQYTKDPALKAKIDAGVEAVLASQLPDGYIGNYLEKDRCRHDWDVWGMKYTMLGLIHYYDATGDKRALDAACRVCDYLRAFFPAKMPLRKSSEWNGLASCSVIEPVVWLYRRTGRSEYLDFAKYALSELEDPQDSCQILRESERGIHVADRGIWTTNCIYGVNIAIKAYESMSCWQGILDIYEETRDKRLLAAALQTAGDIAATEINIAGGGASHERWYRGAERQTRPYAALQETCVQTTWMRLCAKLYSITGESRWVDEIEKTFFNAYLASLNASNDTFAQYTPLSGWRAKGCEHCRMHTNCCNANGPRGFLAYLDSFMRVDGGTAYVNFYSCASLSAKLDDRRLAFDVYGEYPRNGSVDITYTGEEGLEFALALRRPSWRGGMKVTVNGTEVAAKAVGGYVRIERRWVLGDVVSVVFDMPCIGHVRDGHVAFTRGPVVLARDARFGDGDISEIVKGNRKTFKDPLPCDEIRPVSIDMAMAFSVPLKMGPHTVRTIPGRPARIALTDYASAGNTWMQDSSYRVWLPLELEAFSE